MSFAPPCRCRRRRLPLGTPPQERNLEVAAASPPPGTARRRAEDTGQRELRLNLTTPGTKPGSYQD